MNPVFWVLVALGLTAIWFGCYKLYRKIGSFAAKNIENVKNAMKEDNENGE